MPLIRTLLEQQEETLSPLAARSARSRGRIRPERPCAVRTDYVRDVGRILYSLDFRRLRHKTQVFFNPQNDHICTRMEHVLYVSYIANTIARALALNTDLVQAVSLAHDLGHTPFGHSGERTLSQCMAEADPGHPDARFEHERHSLRVADRLARRSGRELADLAADAPDACPDAGPPGPGLNLTFEVRDGIVSHCGETYGEHVLVPDRDKSADSLGGAAAGRAMPATLEACVVRLVDKIAYVGRDIEDAVRAGIMEYEDIPPDLASTLGRSNADIIDTLVTDTIRSSLGQDAIRLSPERGQAMEQLLQENVTRIYRSARIARYEKTARNVVEGLFQALFQALSDPERMEASTNRVFRSFAAYRREQRYGPGDRPVQQVADYIAGMTDSFATRCYEEIYWF